MSITFLLIVCDISNSVFVSYTTSRNMQYLYAIDFAIDAIERIADWEETLMNVS